MATLYGTQTITGALRLQGTAVAGTGNATAVLLVQSTLAGQRQIATQQVSSAQTGDLFTALDYNANVMMKVDQNGQVRSYGIGQQILPLGTPVVTTVTNTGTAGSTTYGYRVAALNSQGSTIASTEVTTTTGNATLDGTNFNVVTWNPVVGAVTYRVYGRYAGAEALLATVNGDGRASSYTFNDTSVFGSAVTGGLNGIPNSSLPVNTTTWAVVGATFVRDQTHGFPGALSGLSTALATSTVASGACTLETSSSANTSRQLVTVTAGQAYSASCYAWLGTMPSITVGINWYDVTQTFLSQSLGSANTTTGSWNRITALNLTAPAGAVAASVVMVFGETAIGQTAWVTAPQIDPGATASGYGYDIPQPTGGTKLVVQQWNGATGNIQEWQQYGGTALSSATPTGGFAFSSGGIGYNAALNFIGGSLVNAPVLRLEGYGNGGTGTGSLVMITNRNISGSPVQVALGGFNGILATSMQIASAAAVFRGITGQTGNIQEWQDPTGGSVLASVTAAGNGVFPILFAQALKDPTTLQGALNLTTAGYAFDLSAGTGSASRVLQRIKMTASQLQDAFQLQDNTGSAVLARISNTGSGQFTSLGTPSFSLATPVISSVVSVGTAGSTTYAYRVSALNAWGETVASTEVTLATGVTTLTGSNYNTVTWGTVTGATGYKVYGRYAGAEALLATVGAVTTYNDQTANLSSAAVTAGLNPLPNSSMNVNTTGWQVTGCTIARDTTVVPPVPGVTASLFTTTVASGGCNTQTGNQSLFLTKIAVTALATYTVSVWVYLGTVPSALVGIQWFDSSGTILTGGASGSGGTAGGWVRLTFTGTANASAAYANMYVQGNTSGIGQTMWFAAPQIDPGSVALPYVRDLPLGTGAVQAGGPVYEGSNRVYSAANPQPSVATSTAVQIASSTAVALTYTSPWANYGSGNALGSYIRTADGWINLQGLITNSGAITSPSTVTTTLPAPADGLAHSFTIWSDIGAVTHRADISATGTLTILETGGAGDALNLDGITYYVGGSTSTYVAGPALAVPTDVPHAMTLITANWINYNTGYTAAKYITTAGGQVYLQGTVNAVGTQTGLSQIASGLPVPADGLDHVFNATMNGTAVAALRLSAAGNLYVQSGSFPNGNNAFLDGIVYETTTAGNAGFASSSFATSVKFGSER